MPRAYSGRVVGLPAALLVAIVAAGVVGCSTTQPELRTGGSQSLYRLELSTPGESFDGRLVLRELGPDWELEVRDALGRLVWAWRVRGSQSAWIDPRAKTWCPSWRGSVFDALPAQRQGLALRRLLRGRLPEPGVEAPAEDGPFEVAGSAGTWIGEVLEGELRSWRLEYDAAAKWWWSGDGTSGELSSSEGLRMRWNRSVIEALAAATPLAPAIGKDLRRDCGSSSLP